MAEIITAYKLNFHNRSHIVMENDYIHLVYNHGDIPIVGVLVSCLDAAQSLEDIQERFPKSRFHWSTSGRFTGMSKVEKLRYLDFMQRVNEFANRYQF